MIVDINNNHDTMQKILLQLLILIVDIIRILLVQYWYVVKKDYPAIIGTYWGLHFTGIIDTGNYNWSLYNYDGYW